MAPKRWTPAEAWRAAEARPAAQRAQTRARCWEACWSSGSRRRTSSTRSPKPAAGKRSARAQTKGAAGAWVGHIADRRPQQDFTANGLIFARHVRSSGPLLLKVGREPATG